MTDIKKVTDKSLEEQIATLAPRYRVENPPKHIFSYRSGKGIKQITANHFSMCSGGLGNKIKGWRYEFKNVRYTHKLTKDGTIYI